MSNTHSLGVGYLLWVFGFMGAHRFYFGKTKTGILYFCTFGLLFIGWAVDAFLIPAMDREADFSYREGDVNYSVAWILLTFLGIFGIHRFYMGKWVTGLLYFCTGGLFLVGYLYDYCTLNEQISAQNQS